MKIEINNSRKFLIPLLLLAAVFLLIGSASATPVANASVDQSVELGATVTLNGTNSSDTDGGPITYNWTINSRPNLSVATIQNPTRGVSEFTPDALGFYNIQLDVIDQYGAVSTDFSQLLVMNTTILNTGNHSYSPAVYGRYIVYEAQRTFGNTDVYLYDLVSGQERQITNNPSYQGNPNIYGNNIVWCDKRNGGYDVYLYNIETGVEKRITTQTATRTNSFRPGIYEDRIVYYDNRNGNSENLNWDIWMYDLSTETETQITNNPFSQFDPDIYGTKIVWADFRDDGFLNVYMYDLETGTETKISNSPYHGLQGRDISLNEDYIVWVDERNSVITPNFQIKQELDLYMYDIQAKIESPLYIGLGFQGSPHISSDYIVWTDSNGLFLYNLNLDSTFFINNINNGPPTIDGTHIVSTSNEYLYLVSIYNHAAPVLDEISDKVVNEGQNLHFSVNGSDLDFDALTFSVSGLPEGFSFKNGIFDWTPSYNNAGNYLVTFSISDGSLSDDQIISIIVNEVNTAPVLDSTSFIPQIIYRNGIVQLNAEGHSPEGAILTYNWNLNAPEGSSSSLNNPNNKNPTFTPDLPGDYVVSVFVSDNYGGYSSTLNMPINVLNRPPTAYAGPDQVARVGFSTALNGTGSSDPDGDSLTYAWTLTGPTGSTSTLSDSTSSQPTFISDLPGDYIAQLTVIDQYEAISTSDSVKVTVTNNQVPLAEAGYGYTVNRNQGVYLYGTGSSDPDGDTLTYYWALNVPSGSLTTLNNPSTSSPYFTPDLPGQYVATLVVTDSYGTSSPPDSASFTAENSVPYAYFEPRNVLIGDSAVFDGTLSSDPDGDELTFLWDIIKPTGSQFTFSDPNSAQQTFTPDLAGGYTLLLTLTDEYGAISQYSPVIMVRNQGEIVNSRTSTSYSTIQEAIDDSEEGDIILVADGRYPEEIYIEYRNVDLQATGDNVVLESVDGQPLITIYGGQSRISGFIMTGAYNDAALRLGSESETEITGNTITESYDGIAIDESYIGHVITQNRITDNENNGITGYNVNYVTIDGNDISNNGNAAINFEGSSDITITNNILNGNGYGILASGLEYATISGNTISDNSQRGLSASSLFDSEITDNIINNNVDYGIELYSGYNVSITRNIITNTEGYGLQFDGDFQDVTLNFNRISGNGLDLYYYNTEGQPLQAENNWWGSNSEPSNIEDTDGLVSYSPWLVLNLSADPEELLIGESSTITADLTQNSNGEDTSGDGTLPDGLEVNFTADLGTIDASATTTDGKATVNYTAQEPGVATVSAAMDTEEVVTNIDVTSPNRPPELDLADQTIAEGDTLHLVLDGSDPDGDSITYSISGQPPESSFDGSTGTFTWTSRYDQAGSYTVTFTVSDGSLTTDQTITITVENTNRAPDMQTIGDKSVNEGQTIEFEVEATDPDGTPLTYSLDMLPPGASFDTATGIFTWTPNYLQAGPNLLTFTVTDGELSDSETIHLDVVNVNQAPVLNPVADQTIPEGQILEFTVEGADPDGQALTYTAGYSVQDLIQLGAVFNSETRTFTWTPSFDQAGSYTIPCTVSDGELSDTKLVNIVVQNTNRMPNLIAIGNRDAYENQNLQFSVDALDPDGDSLTYSAAGLPTGATFDPATRVFSWTPSTGQSGSYMVTFTVSDGDLSVSETVTINVFNTPSGSGVSVSPVDPVSGLSPVTISFSSVLAGGTTSVSTSSSGPEPPAGFVTGEPPLYYEISTTASYQPPITVAIHYDETMFSDESALRLFHYEDGAWMDITTSQDLANNIIYGSVTSLSPFSIFERTASNAPTAVLDGPYAAYEGSEITFDGSASSDPDGDTLTYEWDLDGDGIFETPGMMISKIWIDDYTGTVSLKVTDPSGLFSVASSTVTVTNTAPAATLSSSFMVKVPITMRVAGQPGNSVELQIIQEGVVVASKTIVFAAGSPNEQQAYLLANIDMSKTYTARLVFNTNSQTSGATPVWLIIDGKKTKVATFKSNPNNPASWSQSLNIPLKGLFTLANKEITFNAQASDSGVDTITFEWSFGDGTPLVVNTYTSDGTTVINDSVAHTYLLPGVYQLILTVRDDEGAEVSYQMEVRVV